MNPTLSHIKTNEDREHQHRPSHSIEILCKYPPSMALTDDGQARPKFCGFLRKRHDRVKHNNLVILKQGREENMPAKDVAVRATQWEAGSSYCQSEPSTPRLHLEDEAALLCERNIVASKKLHANFESSS